MKTLSRSNVRKLILAAILMFTLYWAIPAFAGGWAVVSLDALPTQIVAGEPVTIGMMVRQHGQQPLASSYVQVHLDHTSSGESRTVQATPEGETGHYVATVTLPSPGNWRFGVSSGLFPEVQPMPELTVQSAAAVQGSEPAAALNNRWISIASSLGLVLGGGALIWLLRSGRRRAAAAAAAVVVLGLLVAGSSLAASTGQTQKLPQTGMNANALDGELVFISKGCPACHLNRNIDASYQPYGHTNGPELTQFSADPEYLRGWLKDPSAIRPNTLMPNLDLKQAEIEALITFLNSTSQ